MSDPMKHAWNDVAEDFSRLGKVMIGRYQGRAPAATAQEADRSEADAGVRAAFERLVDAGRELGERIADVVAGDEVRAQARQTGQRLSDAMSTSADLLGHQVRGVFKGAWRGPEPVDTVAEDAAPSEPGSPDEGQVDDGSE
ncbi:MAG: hypothetical protein JWM12_2124 [Ilumatobacteraceae bacterium]|nr:hypothetical protein [Ilumatobacteraceae bacterium]